MRAQPDYRTYPWWPQDGNDWVHPQDVPLARRLIPSPRVFRQQGREGAYLVLSYGAHRLRVKPTLRKAIAGDGFNVGDRVEVCSHRGRNRPLIGTIAEMRWSERYGEIHYLLRRRGMTLARPYRAEDLRHLAR